MSPQAQTELNRLEDSPAPRGAAYWQRRALAAEKRVKELEARLKKIEGMVDELSDHIGPQKPPQDYRIFNRQQPDGTFKPLAEFFDSHS